MAEEKKYLTISQLNHYVGLKFSKDPYLRQVMVVGEISNFRLRPSHQYFSLKDENAEVSVTMFRNDFARVNFQPENGMKVLVIGDVGLYEGRGQYQIRLTHMEPLGIGALYQAFQQLQTKLNQEGLFNPAYKKPLVRYPKRIAVITSPSGAVIRDIITTVKRRYPIVQLVLFPAVVQGQNAAASLVGRLKEVNARGDFDTIIIGRGGGSLEDLWPFNEEAVAREIFASQIPIISSVGHETDTTLSDLVADVRAATPTAAAELATPVLAEEIMRIQQAQLRLQQAVRNTLAAKQQIYQRLMQSYVFTNPLRIYERQIQQVDFLKQNLQQIFGTGLQNRRAWVDNLSQRLQNQSPLTRIRQGQTNIANLQTRLQMAQKRKIEISQANWQRQIGRLDAVSPLKVMQRGYAYVQKKGQVVHSVAELEVGSQVALQLADGSAQAKITEIKGE
ncbi:MAG: exodeoxyribonuclease VII large subunit [Ligilactobacillus sp.]|nr:exodeoxyribonuclease VII large subunit [Ligilactobacillus sp.]